MSDKKEKLYVAGISMITPVGSNAMMTAASVKAGISAYTESNYLNGNFDPIKLAIIPDEALQPLNENLINTPGITARQSRMLRLVGSAIHESIKNYQGQIPLYLAGPEPLPNIPLPIRSSFINQLVIQTDLNIDIESSKVFPMGRAAAFYALEYAFDYLSNSTQDYILLGGVDSYLDALYLGILSRDNRLQTVPGQMDAFVPGEAAAFILLCKNKPYPNAKVIYRPGTASEQGGRYSELPYLGDGLSLAFRKAIENGCGDTVSNIYSSLNGEQFFVKEHGVSITRNTTHFTPEYNHLHPAECFGDLGGAFGAVLLGLSIMNSTGYSLCYGSSEHEFRGAVCVG